MTRIFTLLALVVALLTACTQPEPRRADPAPAAEPPAAAEPDAACVEACTFARQMEARAAEAIRADCEADCRANPKAWPKPDAR